MTSQEFLFLILRGKNIFFPKNCWKCTLTLLGCYKNQDAKNYLFFNYLWPPPPGTWWTWESCLLIMMLTRRRVRVRGCPGPVSLATLTTRSREQDGDREGWGHTTLNFVAVALCFVYGWWFERQLGVRNKMRTERVEDKLYWTLFRLICVMKNLL